MWNSSYIKVLGSLNEFSPLLCIQSKFSKLSIVESRRLRCQHRIASIPWSSTKRQKNLPSHICRESNSRYITSALRFLCLFNTSLFLPIWPSFQQHCLCMRYSLCDLGQAEIFTPKPIQLILQRSPLLFPRRQFCPMISSDQRSK